MTTPRVFITGSALLTAAGSGLQCNRQALNRREPVFARWQEHPVAPLAASIREELTALLKEQAYRDHDPVTGLGVLAARQLVVTTAAAREDWGCVVGSSRGPTTLLERHIADFTQRSDCAVKASPTTTANALPSTIQRSLGFYGPHFYVSAACSTGLHAIGTAYALTRSGLAPGFVAGGLEASLTPFTLTMLRRARVYSRAVVDDPWPHKPFHPRRSGMVLGEAAALVGVSRQAEPQSVGGVEILAFAGASEPTGLTGVSPDGRALQQAIHQSLQQADLKPDDIDGIVAHGAGTRKGDQAEQTAYERVFGDQLPPLICHKWLVGHTLGAAGAYSVALAVDHLNTGCLPKHPFDPAWDQRNEQRLRGELRRLLVVTLGFGGNAAAMILGRVDS
jgi:3-oxoacyl-(acyl-carrier-protein) synthase